MSKGAPQSALAAAASPSPHPSASPSPDVFTQAAGAGSDARAVPTRPLAHRHRAGHDRKDARVRRSAPPDQSRVVVPGRLRELRRAVAHAVADGHRARQRHRHARRREGRHGEHRGAGRATRGHRSARRQRRARRQCHAVLPRHPRARRDRAARVAAALRRREDPVRADPAATGTSRAIGHGAGPSHAGRQRRVRQRHVESERARADRRRAPARPAADAALQRQPGVRHRRRRAVSLDHACGARPPGAHLSLPRRDDGAARLRARASRARHRRARRAHRRIRPAVVEISLHGAPRDRRVPARSAPPRERRRDGRAGPPVRAAAAKRHARARPDRGSLRRRGARRRCGRRRSRLDRPRHRPAQHRRRSRSPARPLAPQRRVLARNDSPDRAGPADRLAKRRTVDRYRPRLGRRNAGVSEPPRRARASSRATTASCAPCSCISST